jgi:hypothetical protein
MREEEISFLRCWLLPTNKYSVFEGFTESRLAVSQAWTESSVEDRIDKFLADSEAEKEM